jgi:hypothetical protein
MAFLLAARGTTRWQFEFACVLWRMLAFRPAD